MRNLLLCVAVLGVVATGCDKKAKAGASGAASTSAAPAAKAVTPPAGDQATAPAAGTAAPAAKADGPCEQLGTAVKAKVPASHAADTDAIVECMVDLCHADKWSTDIITCISGTPFDAKACQAKLSDDQFKHLDTAIQAEFGSDGPAL